MENNGMQERSADSKDGKRKKRRKFIHCKCRNKKIKMVNLPEKIRQECWWRRKRRYRYNVHSDTKLGIRKEKI